MSKVNRQSLSENYPVNVDWLMLYAHELEKVGYLSNLKPLIHRKHYYSIDEKMADIKERIGFDLVTKLELELDELSKTSHTHACACAPVNDSCACPTKTAQTKHDPRDIQKMSNILTYIKDMLTSEPHLDWYTVLVRCRAEEGLGFDRLRINHDKLKEFIKSLTGNELHNSVEDVKYTPLGNDNSFDYGNDQADYYSHAKPER